MTMEQTTGRGTLKRDFYGEDEEEKGGHRQTKRFKLKQNIVIPAGTEFSPSPRKTVRFQDGHATAHIGLTKDSCGDLDYFVDPDDPELADWFEEVHPGEGEETESAE